MKRILNALFMQTNVNEYQKSAHIMPVCGVSILVAVGALLSSVSEYSFHAPGPCLLSMHCCTRLSAIMLQSFIYRKHIG